MITYYNTTFTGHYPVGSAAIVRANDATEAALLLNAALVKEGLKGNAEPQDMIQTPEHWGAVVILNDGNY